MEIFAYVGLAVVGFYVLRFVLGLVLMALWAAVSRW